MAKDKDDFLDEDDDFEKLLNNFINSQVDNIPENSESAEDKKDEPMTQSEIDENEKLSQAFEEELAATFSEARSAVEEEKNMPTLGSEESELAQAFMNFQNAVNTLSQNILNKHFNTDFKIDFLYPNYKPSLGEILSDDLVNGWLRLSEIFPAEIASFPTSSTDEEFLNFAETLQNQKLQLAVISYVEILIDMESCELTYQAKLAQYQEKRIKRVMYEEYLARKERQKRFIDTVKKKNFPIDAERLITNYFRVAQKDVDSAFKALTTNPAIFAPIEFSKIKPRFFGLIKVTPKDGIRINTEIGKFMKKVKV